MSHAAYSNVTPFSRPVKADTDDGFTKLANSLLDHLARTEVTARQRRVIDVVIRKTFGFGKKIDQISASQIADAMEYTGNQTHIHADIRTLKKRRILLEQGRKIGLNTVLSDWQKVTENGQLSDRKRSQKEPKTVTKGTENGHFQPESSCSDVDQTDRKRSHDKPKTVTNTDRKRSPQKKKETSTKEKDLSDCRASAPSRKPKLDFSPWLDLGADPDLVDQWRQLRKEKRAPIVPLAIKKITNQFQLAVDAGRTVDACLELALMKAWTGFEYSWMQNHEKDRSSTNSFAQPFQPSNSNSSWADGLIIDHPDEQSRHWDD